jgi:AAA domain
LPRGAIVVLTGNSESGKSTLATAWARDVWRDKGVSFLFLDRENPGPVVADRFARLGIEDGPGKKFWRGWLGQEAPQPDSSIVRAFAKEHKG